LSGRFPAARTAAVAAIVASLAAKAALATLACVRNSQPGAAVVPDVDGAAAHATVVELAGEGYAGRLIGGEGARLPRRPPVRPGRPRRIRVRRRRGTADGNCRREQLRSGLYGPASLELSRAAENALRTAGLRAKSEHPVYDVDHYPFAEAGAAAITVCEYYTESYHTKGDTAEGIDPGELDKVGGALYALVLDRLSL
jgi:hypothetical protein